MVREKGKLAAEEVLSAIRKFWLNYGAEGLHILGVSGGIDSMVLLEGISRLPLGAEARKNILVVHVNHGLRGAEANADESLVGARATELGLATRSFRLAWPESLSGKPSQNQCRLRREEIFASLCRGRKGRIWLAHHLNDQAETVLFRLIRGTGAKGLAGMRPEAGRKLRPFLAIPKSTLQAAAHFWGVKWREDSSNQDPRRYERNWLRLEIIPQIEARRPGFQAKLAALAEEAGAWPLRPTLSLFSPREGILFSRPPPQCSTQVLSETFGLARAHSQDLSALLQKPAGQLHAEGVRFSWSAGVLLAEKGVPFAACPEKLGAQKVRSELGEWDFTGVGDVGFPARSAGERVKKEFQALRVPRFFRAAVPLYLGGERPLALVPRRLRSSLVPAGIHYTPSALGAWWLQ